MSTTAVLTESPLSHALSTAIIPKLTEVGWSTGTDDDAALAEYIVLLLVNGKTQEEIAAELSGDLLNLGSDDPQVKLFSDWLFEQIPVLSARLGDGGSGGESVAQDLGANGTEDAIMGDASEAGKSTVYAAISLVDLTPDPPDLSLPPKPPRLLTSRTRPTGPKSMRNGGGSARNPRDKRMLGHLAKAMDRSTDAVLHRVRSQVGNERINTHRAPPTGPRQQMSIRGGARAMNGRNVMTHGQVGGSAGNTGNITTDQQFQMFAMLEQQKQMMISMLNPQQQQEWQQMAGAQVAPAINPNFRPQQGGKSLFDRIQAPSQRQQNDSRNGYNKFGEHRSSQDDALSSSMDVQMSQEKSEPSPDSTCRYNLACTNKDCKFAHQSPEAPPGTAIDVTDTCSFGAACKNRKCTGRHPSPSQRIAHQTEMDCKFYPNCTNARCPFRHPTTPACRNGADCTVPNCKFTHVKTLCKFNPCLNPACIFKHEEGQKRGKFEDKVWVAKEHISERKFEMDEGKPEELIIPGQRSSQESSSTTELIT